MRSGFKNLAVVALAGTAAFFLWKIQPEANPIIPRCLFLQSTGFYCPGCGSLRAIHHLLQGDLAQAWGMNPLTVLLLPGLIFLATAELLFRRYDLALRIRSPWIWVLLAVFLLFGILRNLPYPLLSVLAPHATPSL